MWNRPPGHLPKITGLDRRLLSQRNDIRSTLGRNCRQAVLLSVGRLGFDFLSLLAALRATGGHPRPSLVLLAYAAAAIVALVPLTPGGLGIVEASRAGLLVLAGVAGGQAVVATSAYRLGSYWLPVVAGGIAYVLFRRRYPSHGVGRSETSRGETVEIRSATCQQTGGDIVVEPLRVCGAIRPGGRCAAIDSGAGGCGRGPTGGESWTRGGVRTTEGSVLQAINTLPAALRDALTVAAQVVVVWITRWYRHFAAGQSPVCVGRAGGAGSHARGSRRRGVWHLTSCLVLLIPRRGPALLAGRGGASFCHLPAGRLAVGRHCCGDSCWG